MMTKEEQALVCEWLGIPATLEEWIFTRNSRGDITSGCKRDTPLTVYPNLLDWSGFGLMVEALERKGRHVDFALNRYCGKYEVEVNTNDRGEVSGCDSMPEALAQAVLALAKKERG
jgi:hypothetical protein